MNPARVVFEIKLENGAQKVVTVKSALVLSNKTDMILEMKLDIKNGEFTFILSFLVVVAVV